MQPWSSLRSSARRFVGAGVDPLAQPGERDNHNIERGTVSITKHLVEAMNGSLGVESTHEHARSSRVDPPAASPAEHSGSGAEPRRNETPDANRSDVEPHHVVYVEDDVINAQLMTAALADRPDIALEVFPRAHVALEHCRSTVPDLMLLDMYLPDLRGDAVIRELRADRRTASIPVIVVTADATTRTRAIVDDLGVDGFFTKPIVIADLMAAIDGIVAGRRADVGHDTQI